MKAITAVSLSVCLQGIYQYLSESFARWRIYGILKTGIQPQLSDYEQKKKQNQSFADDPARKQ